MAEVTDAEGNLVRDRRVVWVSADPAIATVSDNGVVVLDRDIDKLRSDMEGAKAEAIDAALCHGWIDGQLNPYDADWWLIRFTPRKPRSKWSQNNRERAEQLIAAGRMAPRGLAEVEAAKADGRWEAAYASASKAEVPPDLRAALDANPAAAAFFATLTGNNRYAILYRIALTQARSSPDGKPYVERRMAEGEIVGLIGPNGAGKTTCFYSIMGLVKPDSGRIFLDGQDITELPMYRRAILGLGYLPQETSIFRGMISSGPSTSKLRNSILGSRLCFRSGE